MGRGAVWRGSGLPCGQRAACESTGDGRERGRRPCLRAPPHSPAYAGLFVGRRSATAAAHAHGPLCASACKVIGPPAARMAFPPSRAPRHPCPWRGDPIQRRGGIVHENVTELIGEGRTFGLAQVSASAGVGC